MLVGHDDDVNFQEAEQLLEKSSTRAEVSQDENTLVADGRENAAHSVNESLIEARRSKEEELKKAATSVAHYRDRDIVCVRKPFVLGVQLFNIITQHRPHQPAACWKFGGNN